MDKEELKQNSPDLDMHFRASKDELSLKAKGAGLFVLIALSLSGIIFLGYLMSVNDGSSSPLFALGILFYLTTDLIKKLAGILDVIKR